MVGTLLLVAPAPVRAIPAVTYYVAQSGTPAGTPGDGTGCGAPDFVGGDHTPIAAAVDTATDGDTIYLCAGTYAIESTIDLSGETITLKGAGAARTILDGGGDNQILVSAGAVVVSDLTFHDGFADLGGAIEAGTTATVSNSTFTDNVASTAGGAIVAYVEVTVTSSTFTGNSADLGGAIASSTTATVTSSTFTGNSADLGGAIFAFTATVTSSTFTRNMASEHGGAIMLAAPAAEDLRMMRRNTFRSNTAQVGGGAITLGPCEVPGRSEAARVERANRFTGNRATEQRRTMNIELWTDECG